MLANASSSYRASLPFICPIFTLFLPCFSLHSLLREISGAVAAKGSPAGQVVVSLKTRLSRTARVNPDKFIHLDVWASPSPPTISAVAVLEGLEHLLGLDWIPKSKRTAFGQPASYFVNSGGGSGTFERSSRSDFSFGKKIWPWSTDHIHLQPLGSHNVHRHVQQYHS